MAKKRFLKIFIAVTISVRILSKVSFLQQRKSYHKKKGNITTKTRGTVLVERKPPPTIDYALCIISKHILASFPREVSKILTLGKLFKVKS